MWFSVFCTTCTFQTTKRSKYVYSLLLFNESQLPLIEYAKTVNSTASLVAAISNIQKLHNAGGYNKIQFITCSAKAVVRAERKKISIIVKNGKELTSKVLLRAPRWTWQMFIQKDKTKLIKFLKITTKIANLNALQVSPSSSSYASSFLVCFSEATLVSGVTNF